jgi:hypothetical protein
MAAIGQASAQAKPSPFQNCWDRIGRAKEHCKAFVESWDRLQPKEIYGIRVSVDDDGLGVVTVKLKAPTVAMALEFGEMLYQLRAALDGSIYAAAILKERKSPPTDEENLEFPFRPNERKFREAGWKLGPLLETRVADIVESVQPYKASTPEDFRILTVNDWARKDRHRRLHVVMVRNIKSHVDLFLPDGCVPEWVKPSTRRLVESECEVLRFKLVGWVPGSKVDTKLGFQPEVVLYEPTFRNVEAKPMDFVDAVSDLVKRIEDCF